MTVMDGVQYLTGVGMIAGFGSQLLYKPETFAKHGSPKPPKHVVIPLVIMGILTLVVNAAGFEFLCLLSFPMACWADQRLSRLRPRALSPAR
ncbi:MAG: hypothetical protein HUU19_09220 [Phycisphaerales bacterium]|nr:hypothetical protein [Phycisphaerales bacterium]